MSFLALLRIAAFGTGLLGVTAAWSFDDDAPFLGDYGGVGLWQTPTARFGPDGQFALGVVANSPYNRLVVNVQPVEGVEATFRYTDITNRLYSETPEFSGNQSYKDRSLDLRFRLLDESENWPALALGLRDLGGTQLFGAQYLVASRRFYDFDFSLGLGWGRLASGGPLPNPFKRQQGSKGNGFGASSVKDLFSGPDIGVFGGVTWDAPIEGLQLSAEYDPNDYENEPLDNTQRVRLPVNFGLKYRLRSGATAGLSYQRGSILSFQLGFGVNLASPVGIPKVLDPRPPLARQQALKVAEAAGQQELPASDPVELAKRLDKALKAQRVSMSGFALSADGSEAQVWITPSVYRDTQKLLGRTARTASTVLPGSVRQISITEVSSGVEAYDAVVQRQALENTLAGGMAADEFQRTTVISAPAADKPVSQYSGVKYPQSGWSLNPSLRSSVGGPDSFYFGQLWLKLGGYINLTPSWNFDGALGFNLYNNFDGLKLESDSQLPKVRSDIKNYLKDGEQALVRLETNYIEQLAPQWYGRVSAGIFEEMYGGVAGEVLYRPADPRWAVGVNINRVRQRDFDQKFSFRDYEVTTGHITGYFEFAKPSVLLKLSAGQYLAGDRGVTADLSRQFPNGIRIGVFATKTNVSAKQFGEGEFDKGIYFILPLDAMLPRSANGSGGVVLRPLTRDGGQMVRDGRSLYDTTYGAVKARMPLRDNLFFE
ncbi:MAG: YjbH domain-containing protein [Pseudomonadota bacterium]